MAKSCQQCKRMKPMVVRWFVHNYGTIPWNGFMLPREKRALGKAFTVIDETQDQMPPEFYEHVRAYLTKESENNE